MASTFHQTKDLSFMAVGQIAGAGTTYSSGFDVSAYDELCVFAKTTAISATATLTVTVQHSPDDSDYYNHSSLDAISATGNTYKTITQFGKYARLKYVLAGTTPTIDLGLTGVAKT